MTKRNLAPDAVILEFDPWGVLRAYALFGQWEISTVMWDPYCPDWPSTLDPMVLGEAYRTEWLKTGKEPKRGPWMQEQEKSRSTPPNGWTATENRNG